MLNEQEFETSLRMLFQRYNQYLYENGHSRMNFNIMAIPETDGYWENGELRVVDKSKTQEGLGPITDKDVKEFNKFLKNFKGDLHGKL